MKEDNVIKWISPYIDGELDGEKRLKIEEYLSARPDIAAKFRAEARMEGVIKSMLRPDKAMEKAWTRATEKICVGDSQTINRWPALAAGLFFCFLLLGAWQTYVVANTDFIRSAIQYHKSYISDRVPLAFETGSFKELGEYFAQKMPGTVKCMYMLGESDAMPIGARVGHLKEVPVAYVICHVDNEPISIFMMDRQNFARFKQAVRINQSPEEAQHFQIGEMSAVALKQADGIICAVGKVKAGEIERHLFESLKS